MSSTSRISHWGTDPHLAPRSRSGPVSAVTTIVSPTCCPSATPEHEMITPQTASSLNVRTFEPRRSHLGEESPVLRPLSEAAQSFPDSSRGAKAVLPTVGLVSGAAGNRDRPRKRRILRHDGNRVQFGGADDVLVET